MTLNNLDLIKPLLSNSDGIFYHLFIIRRGKDHPELLAANKLIKTLLVRSIEHLESIMPDVISLCEHYKARAYINVAPKSLYKLNTLILSKLADNLHTDNIVNPYHTLNSACGELQAESKCWVVDVDSKDAAIVDSVLDTINKCESKFDDRLIATIPTLNGCHFITHPFNLQEFRKPWPNVDVHKNNPTILYIPDLANACINS